MKRLLFILVTIMAASTMSAQETDGCVAFFTVVNNSADIMPKTSAELLDSKMQQAVTSAGYGSSSRADRFVLVAKPAVITKDVAPTTPPRINQKVEITFIVGDVFENKTYVSNTVTLSGIGINETKAWDNALSQLKPTNPALKEMFDEAYKKIVAYYSANCQSLMAKAESLAARGEYDGAIALMMDVPDICHDCFTRSQQRAVEFYQQKKDAEGEALLSKAKSEWAAAPNSEGAKAALVLLSQISPYSSAFAEKDELMPTIVSKLSSDEQRSFEAEQKRYNDELRLHQKEGQMYHQRKMAEIAACRSVAEKWVENRPETKIYLNW